MKLYVNKRPSRKSEPLGAWTVHRALACKPSHANPGNWEVADAEDIDRRASAQLFAACSRCWGDEGGLKTDFWVSSYVRASRS